MKYFSSLFLILMLVSCSKEQTNRNPYLQEIGFVYDVNLNLPLYLPLTNIGNAVRIPTQGAGIRGIIITNVGFDQFRAFEASCPNHAPNDCSTLVLDGQTAVCPCDDLTYSVFTGQLLNRPDDGNRYYDLLEYRTSLRGSSVIVSN